MLREQNQHPGWAILHKNVPPSPNTVAYVAAGKKLTGEVPVAKVAAKNPGGQNGGKW
jgi:hypothetical protein